MQDHRVVPEPDQVGDVRSGGDGGEDDESLERTSCSAPAVHAIRRLLPVGRDAGEAVGALGGQVVHAHLGQGPAGAGKEACRYRAISPVPTKPTRAGGAGRGSARGGQRREAAVRAALMMELSRQASGKPVGRR